jgi:hypothetical protein
MEVLTNRATRTFPDSAATGTERNLTAAPEGYVNTGTLEIRKAQSGSTNQERPKQVRTICANPGSPRKHSWIRRGKIGRRERPRPNKLSVGCAGLAVSFEMCFGRFLSVVRCVEVVSAG